MEDRDISKYFYDNLLAEQNHTYSAHMNIPIELEYTSLGSNFFNLRETLFGNKSLDPWNRVSFRVIQQIANVLQNLDPLSVNELKYGPVEKKVEAMKDNLSKGLLKRIKSELDIWQINKETEYESFLSHKPFYERVIVQHHEFSMNSGLYLLTTFLTRKNVKKGVIKSKDDPMSRFMEDTTNNPLVQEKLFNQTESK
jgi:hypothetical protein